jgi:hypothetical protein
VLNRAKVGIGVATIGMALSLVPALSASASIARSASIQKSGLCKAYTADQKAELKTSTGSALEKAIEAGNFTAVKKALLSSFAGQSKAESEMNAFLSGASSKVRAAAGVILKFDGTLKGIIEKSTSMTQFESGISTAESNPKVTAALKTLDGYTNGLCGAPPTTSIP